MKLADPVPEAGRITIGLFNRKANLGGLRAPIGFEIRFTDERTDFKRVELADVAELATTLSIKQRIYHLLRNGPMQAAAIAEELDSKTDTVTRTARRYRDQFIVLQGGALALRGRDQ